MTDPPPTLHPSRVRGLIFDLDGTLVDSYPAITASLNHARLHYALPPMSIRDVRPRVGRGLEILIAELVGPDCVEAGVRLFRERYALVYAEGTRALPGVASTLRILRDRGLRLSVASNKPARFSVPILRGLKLLSLFDSVQGPDTAGATKPDPGMVRACLREMRIQRHGALYVGDMLLDVETAARAGVPVLLVPGGSTDEPELRGTGQPVLESFSGLCRLLGV